MKANYIIDGIKGFDLTTYLKAMKAKYGELTLFLRDNRVHIEYDPNKDVIIEEWANVFPLTVEEAFAEKNQEKRRVLFNCIGPANLFRSLEPTLINRTVLKLKNRVWNNEGTKAETKEVEDVYELYTIPAATLFKGAEFDNLWIKSQVESSCFAAVRCWCTTTGREYWIFVDDAARRSPDVHTRQTLIQTFSNAIAAIAWTFRVGTEKEDIEEVYRQGDCLVIKAKKGAKILPREKWWHMDEQTYLNKLKAQS